MLTPQLLVFAGEVAVQEMLQLFYCNDTPIKRHIKLKAEAHPYDLAFEEYFEQRLERTWRDSMAGQWKVLHLWQRQQKCCPVCRFPITFETEWNIHDIVEKVKGGSDELDNLVLLHPNCHGKLNCCD
jgi:RNA-directed DNA polymerase